MTKKNRTSASGEKAAVSGYQAQYEYSACRIFHFMRERELSAVSVANKDAGILDDLVLIVQGRAHTTQVKSTTLPTPLSLHTELIKNQLIADIASSWKKLEAVHGAGNVRVHYIFPGHFSPRDRKLNPDKTETRPVSSAEFASFLNRDDLSEEIILNSQWAAAFDELKGVSGLEGEFIRFVNDLVVADNTELIRNQISSYPPSERRFPTEIKNHLPSVVTHNTKTFWSEAELIRALGWRTPLSQRHFHDFPVPPDFQANDETEQKLLKAIKSHTRGYLSLLGPPGSGKSTLLQRTLASTSDFSVVRYLAYVPENRQGVGRAEPGSFLNDLTVQLALSGLRQTRFGDDLGTLREQLLLQFEDASKRFARSGRKTVVVVDGLDHIPREEKIPVSFLRELPSADVIPDGVLIVLGTQHLDLGELRESVRQQASAANRQVLIQPLSRVAVYSLAEMAELSDIVEREELYAASAGHPLTVRYFIEALKGVTEKAQATRILSHSDGLGRNLKEIYERVWRSLAPNKNSMRVLGLLARADKSISPHELSIAVSEDAVEDVLQRASFLLQRGMDQQLSIFHNSFRLFVVDETGKIFGVRSEDREREFNITLAEISGRAPAVNPQHWMQIRYLYRAQELSRVLSIATPEYFRRSLAAFRPTSDIIIDLQFAFGATKPTRNRIRLVEYLLISKEIEYRLEAVSEFDPVETFLALGETGRALDSALDPDYTGTGWLDLVDFLWAEERYSEARAVFEANEPLDTLFETNRIHQHGEMDEVQEWISRAHRFRPLDRLVALIDGLDNSQQNGIAQEGHSLREDMFFNLARGYVRDNPASDIKSLCARLQLSARHADLFFIEAAAQLERRGNGQAARLLLDQVEPGEVGELPNWCRLLAAKVSLKLSDDAAASALLKTASIPSLSRFQNTYGSDNYANMCREIYELRILAAQLKCTVSLEQTEKEEFHAKIQAKVDELANAGLRAGMVPDEVIIGQLRTVLLFLAHAQPTDTYSTARPALSSALDWFGGTIIDIARKQSAAALADVVQIIDDLVNQRATRLAVSDDFRLAVATKVFACDGNQSKAKQRIAETLQLADTGHTPQEVVQSYKQCAIAYASVGLPHDAEQCLAAMHQYTFGYWLRAKKEPQYEFWIDAYRRACNAAPDRAGEFACEFGRFLIGMEQTEGSGTAQRVVRDLLIGAAPSRPAVAALIERLFDTKLTSWTESVSASLEGIVLTAPQFTMICIKTYCELVVPFARGGESAFIGVALTALPSEHVDTAVAQLVESIETWCAPTGRKLLLDAIHEAVPGAASELDAALSRTAALTACLIEQHHNDGEREPAPGEEYERANSLTDLAAMSDGKSDYGPDVDYSYSRRAAVLSKGASRAEIDQFILKAPLIKCDARFMTASAKEMLRQGDRGQALIYFTDAEHAANNGHWSRFFGGEKLALQQLRICLFGDQGREEGWDVLLDELSTGRTSGTSLFLNLSDVLELVSVALPWVEIWEATQRHLQQYREYQLADHIVPQASVHSSEGLIAYILAAAFDLNCPTILPHARQAAMGIAIRADGEQIFSALLKQMEPLACGPRECAALVYRTRKLTHLSPTLVDAVSRLARSDDFVVVEQVRRVQKYLGLPLREASIPIPKFYELAVTGAPVAEDFKTTPGIGSGTRPVWTDDPWTWTATLKFPLRMLEKATPFSLEALRRRCAEFMRREGGRAAFGPEMETRVRRRLEMLELKFPFWRLLPLAAERGFGKVLNELVDADAIDQSVIPAIWSEIGGPSLADYDLPTERRPEWLEIGPILQKKFGGIDHDTWLNIADDLLYIPVPAGMFLLAEVSLIRVRSWRENYTSVRLSLPEKVMRDDVDETLQGLPRLDSIDRPIPMYKQNASKAVCTIVTGSFGDLRDRTLTICPYVMHELKWKRSANPLQIVDEAGDMVAKTVCWQDGTDMFLWSETELYGEGQALVLHPKGYAALRALNNTGTIRRKIIQRIAPERKPIVERVATDVV